MSSASSATCSAPPPRARRCSSISTTGRARLPTRRRRMQATIARGVAPLTRRRPRGAIRPAEPVRVPATLADQPAGRAEPPARPERELRARADGAAHARRRRRLHAAGCAGCRARLHRVDDRGPAPGRQRSASSRGCTTTARRSCSASGSRPAAASRTARRCSTSWRRTRRRRSSSRPSWRAASSPTRRRPRWSIAPRAAFRETGGDIREVVRTIVTSPEFFSPRPPIARRSRRRSSSSSVRGPRDRYGGPQRAAAGAGAAQARHAALRLPAADRLRRQGRSLGQHRRAAQSHELRVADLGRQDGRCAAIQPRGDRSHRRRQRCPGESALAGDVSERRPRRSRRRPTTPQALALVLGSPEFQRR